MRDEATHFANEVWSEHGLVFEKHKTMLLEIAMDKAMAEPAGVKQVIKAKPEQNKLETGALVGAENLLLTYRFVSPKGGDIVVQDHKKGEEGTEKGKEGTEKGEEGTEKKV